jgi:NhaP-type Na+/H+ or K+/H+ antiporter
MDNYLILIALTGLAAFGMAWMPALSRKTGISYSIIYVSAGVLLYTFFPGVLPEPDPMKNGTLTMHFTEIVVLVSLMGTGIKIDRSFSLKNWASPLKLISLTMLLCIAAAAVMGYTLLGFDLASALLIGAVLAPTDPVLASDVQVDPPNTGKKFETKFALTAEAGMNDGVAFPFTWLAISVALTATGTHSSLLTWFAYDLVYKLVAGVAIGYLMGRLVGYMVFQISKKYKFLKTKDGFLAISLTLMVYGITELAQGYGFVSVFVCAVTLRHFEKDHAYHDELHSFTDQAERLLVAILLILFGGSLVSGILQPLTWKMVLFTLVFLFLVRPLAAYASVFKSDIHLKEKLSISFFGIRGMGSVFYLAFAFQEVHFQNEDKLWAIVAFTILLSVVIHGITATPIMTHLQESLPEEDVPD